MRDIPLDNRVFRNSVGFTHKEQWLDLALRKSDVIDCESTKYHCSMFIHVDFECNLFFNRCFGAALVREILR